MLTMQKLDELAEKHLAVVPSAPVVKPQPVTARDARHQILGAIKIIARMSGMDMTLDVHPTELLVQRIDEMEAQAIQREQQHKAELQALRDALAVDKDHYQKSHKDEIASYKKALRNIAARLEIYRNPFENLPFSKWKNEAKGKWMLAVGETVDWAVQRADNQLDPTNAVVIAADEE